MTVQVRMAGPEDAELVAAMVSELTAEITLRCGQKLFQGDNALTIRLCEQWLREGHYQALVAYVNDEAAGVATLAESYALYAGGKIGIVQECYVAPAYRVNGVGRRLMEGAAALAAERGWACLELCTPPMPEFSAAIDFYQRHAFVPVGGRKMRRQCGGALG